MVKSLRNTNIVDGFGRTAFLVLIYFIFLYNFKVPGFPFGTVVLFLLFCIAYIGYSFFKGKIKQEKLRTSKMLISYLLWNVFLIIYVFGLLEVFGRGDGTTPFKEYIEMLIILPLFYISGKAIFRNTEELMKILYIGVVIQSIIIIVALFSPILSIGLTLLFPEGAYNTDIFGGFEMAIAKGYKVGLGVFSSAGSLKMAIGQIGACYFLIKSRDSKLVYHLVLYLFIAVATSLVARTGLLISVVGLLCVIIAKRKQGGARAIKFVILVCALSFIGYIIVIKLLPFDFIEDTFQRIIDTADNGIHDTYFRGYTGEGGDNTIPPLCPETIIGLGITTGVSGSGITTITDGGFLRNYSAMGLIVAIINYLMITIIFKKQFKAYKSQVYKGIIIFMFLVLLIGEFKEYFIYYVSPMCFFFLIFNLMEKESLSYIRLKEKYKNQTIS